MRNMKNDAILPEASVNQLQYQWVNMPVTKKGEKRKNVFPNNQTQAYGNQAQT